MGGVLLTLCGCVQSPPFYKLVIFCSNKISYRLP